MQANTVRAVLLFLVALAFALAASLSAARAAPSSPAYELPPDSAVRAPEWDALFDRTSGWTGADGVYTVAMSGSDRPGSAASTTTFWVFSDTYIGAVTPDNKREGAVLINNTMARLVGAAPDPARMTFYWNTKADGAPAARLVPITSSAHWFWPMDGIIVKDRFYLFTLLMKTGSGGSFNFAVEGISLVASSPRDSEPFKSYTQVQTPLYLPPIGPAGDINFGQALMANTAAAGAPHPDGYLYIYGLRNDAADKKLLVARVRPDRIEKFSDYRYWDGRTWQPFIRSARPLTGRLSAEFSVTPLSDGRYLLVFFLDALGASVAVRYGNSPAGPWGEPIVIWQCPEDTLTRKTYCYNAKAHPHLSEAGNLLISYHVNTSDGREHYSNADIYRPRFIRVKTAP